MAKMDLKNFQFENIVPMILRDCREIITTLKAYAVSDSASFVPAIFLDDYVQKLNRVSNKITSLYHDTDEKYFDPTSMQLQMALVEARSWLLELQKRDVHKSLSDPALHLQTDIDNDEVDAAELLHKLVPELKLGTKGGRHEKYQIFTDEVLFDRQDFVAANVQRYREQVQNKCLSSRRLLRENETVYEPPDYDITDHWDLLDENSSTSDHKDQSEYSYDGNSGSSDMVKMSSLNLHQQKEVNNNTVLTDSKISNHSSSLSVNRKRSHNSLTSLKSASATEKDGYALKKSKTVFNIQSAKSSISYAENSNNNSSGEVSEEQSESYYSDCSSCVCRRSYLNRTKRQIFGSSVSSFATGNRRRRAAKKASKLS